MTFFIQSGDLKALVTRKRIKHLYLRVLPPDGRIQISAPMRVSQLYITTFLESRRDWIAKRQARIASQAATPPKQYLSGELHPLWGQDYPLQVREGTRQTRVQLKGETILLQIPKGKTPQDRRAALEAWYRRLLKAEAQRQIPAWEQRMNVEVKKVYVRRMTSLWGSCTPSRQSIRLNTALAELSLDKLEYILVHEMVHLLEASHNQRFYTLMSQYMPDWKPRRAQLKARSLRKVD